MNHKKTPHQSGEGHNNNIFRAITIALRLFIKAFYSNGNRSASFGFR